MAYNFYRSDVVAVNADAELAIVNHTNDDSVFYHFTCDTKDWDDIFANVQFKIEDQAQEGATQETDANGGDIYRWMRHGAGVLDLSGSDLIEEMKNIVNFYMMKTDGEGGDDATGNATSLAVADGIHDEADQDEEFLPDGETWSNMLADSTGGMSDADYENIIDTLGSAGKLVNPGTFGAPGAASLVEAQIIDTTEVNLYVTYEIDITIQTQNNEGGDSNTDADEVHTDKTFAFTGGKDASNVDYDDAAVGNDDTGASVSGLAGKMRLRVQYQANGSGTQLA